MWLQKPVSSPFRTNHHKHDFACFSLPLHGVFTGFSWPFHGFIIFANLEGTLSLFQTWDIFGGATLLGSVSQEYVPKSNGIEKISVLKVWFNQAVSKGLGPSFSEDLDPQGDVENPP
jgi:hypothetical protein